MAKILLGNIKGPKGDAGPQGPIGPQGPQGPQGPKGDIYNTVPVANNTAASVQAVPSNSAPCAEVKEIGGMTHRVNVGTEEAPEYVLRSALVTEVESVGVNIRNTLPIPEAVRNLDGYGWGINESIYNYVDFEKKQFVKRVGCVDMGTLTWTKYANGTGSTFQAAVPGIKTADTLPLRAEGWLCSKYGASTVLESGNLDNKTAIRHSVTSIFVRDDDYAVAATFKADMSGVMLYYELKTPVITDISDLLPDDNLICVEGGGTVTMVNEYGYDVPNTVIFYEGINEAVVDDAFVSAYKFVGDLVGTAKRSEYAKAAKAAELAKGQSPSVSCLRNSKLVNAETNPTINGELCWTLE